MSSTNFVTGTTIQPDWLNDVNATVYGGTSPAGTLRADLASTTDPAKGSAMVGHLPAGTGAVGRTVQSRLRDNVSAFDFLTAAQIADVRAGTAAVDVTAALQAAIDAVQAAGGGLISFPPGTYRLTASLVLSGATPVWLVGTWASILKNFGTGASITVGNASADQTADVRILGMYVLGQAGTAQGIYMKRMHSARIEGCRVASHGSDGLRLEGCYASWVLNNYCNNNSGSGINAQGLAAAGNDFLQIIGNKFLANAGRGIYIDNRLYGPAGQRVELNDVEGNATGIQVDVGSVGNTEGLTIRGNYLENNTGANVSLGEDGGTGVLNSPWIESNAFMFGTVSGAVNAVRIGAAVRQLNLLGNGFVTSDLVVNVSVTLGVIGGNKSNGVVPGGFDGNGGWTTSQLRFYQPGGGAFSAMAMSGGVLQFNFPLGLADKFYPADPTGVYQTATGLYGGTGVPSNGVGANGDIYLRSDGGAGTAIYQRRGGVWTAVA